MKDCFAYRSQHPYLTANLKKHVGRHSEDLQVADGVIGRISYIEQQKAQGKLNSLTFRIHTLLTEYLAWYNYLFASVPDPAPSSPSPSVTVSNRTSNRNSTRNTGRNVDQKVNYNA